MVELAEGRRRTQWLSAIMDPLVREEPDRDFTHLRPLVRLGRMALLMNERQKRLLKPFGLTPAEYSILGTLRRSGGAQVIRPSHLYSVVGGSPAGVTKMIDRLEARRLVRRVSDATDGRRVPVRLTAKGVALEKQALAALTDSADALMTGVSKREVEQIDRALDTLQGLLESEWEALRR